MAPPAPRAEVEAAEAEWRDERRPGCGAAGRARTVSADRREARRDAAGLPGSELADTDGDDALVEVATGSEPSAVPAWRRGRGATAFGRAVHLVLQDVDLASGAGVDGLAVSAATTEGIPELAAAIGTAARDDLSTHLCSADAARSAVAREMYVAAPVGDRVVEGYVDLLIRTADGLVLVDYKTDHVDGAAAIDARAGDYALQLAAYAAAVERATGEPVVSGVLVFGAVPGADGPVERRFRRAELDTARVEAMLRAGDRPRARRAERHPWRRAPGMPESPSCGVRAWQFVMRASQRLLRLVLILVLGGFTVGVCLVALGPGVSKIAASAKYTGTVAPDLRPLEGPTTLYDADGNVMDRLGDLDRTPVGLDEVPAVLVDAVVATEDRTFFDNPGVDVRASVRAFLSNVGSGDIGQGGSTITQQLIKNRYFTNPKRDLDRKVREAILAARLTGEWSKRRILQEYLNTVYFGANAYGVQAAAQRIIGQPLEKLGLADAALLAGLIKDPINYDPFVHPDAARHRRATVLRSMAHQKKITRAEEVFAGAQALPTRPDCSVAPNDPKCSLLEPHSLYSEEVKNRLLELPALGPDEKAAAQRVFAGGLRVYTAYDPALEAKAQAAVDSTVGRFAPSFQAGMAVMDPRTGAVPAIVNGSGRDYRGLDLATMGPVIPDSGRAVGSTFKGITLATALANGYSPKDTVSGSAPCRIKYAGRNAGSARLLPVVGRLQGRARRPLVQERRRERRHGRPLQPDEELGELRVPPPADERRSGEGPQDGGRPRPHPSGREVPVDRHRRDAALTARDGHRVQHLRRRGHQARPGVHHPRRGQRRACALPGTRGHAGAHPAGRPQCDQRAVPRHRGHRAEGEAPRRSPDGRQDRDA